MAVTEEVLPVEAKMEGDIEWEAWIRERNDPRRSQGKPEALESLVVLDVSTASMAGVFCSSLLAEFGAEVIRVEPPGGDIVRSFTPFGTMHHGTGLGYLVEARNKLHVTLNLGNEMGRELLRKLARRADILVETFRPGEADAMGVGYRQLLALNPRLIYAAITTYGQWGPDAQRQKAKQDRDVADQALSGILHITGESASGSTPSPHEVPTKAGAWLGWYAGGAWAAFGVLAALRWRAASGRGQMVDVSGAEAIMRWMEDMVAYYQRAGVDRQRVGLLDTSVFPYTFVPTRDGYAMIAGFSDVNFTALTTIMGKEHLRTDPRFKTFLDRANPTRRQELYEEVCEWSRRHTSQEILTKVNEYVLGKKGPGIVATGRVNRSQDTLAEENWWIRGAFEKVEDPVYGELVIQSPASRMTETPPRVKWVCRTPGADNGYVYLKYLGLGKSRLEELAARAVV